MKANIKKIGESLLVNGDELLNTADITDHAVSHSEANNLIGLFAAAPELLEALKLIASLEKTPEDEWDAVEVVIPKMCEIARTAIAKAGGDTA